MTTATEPSEALSAPQPLSDATWSGELGTLLPFLVGLIVVAGVQPSSILLAFGLSLVIVGLRFGVLMPVQPMKAVGAAALGHTVVVTKRPTAWNSPHRRLFRRSACRRAPGGPQTTIL